MTAPMPTAYDIRVRGHLDDHWARPLGGLTVARRADGTTSLHGPLGDQAHLHSVLTAVRDLGVDLLSVAVAAGEPPRPTLDRVLRTERLTLRAATLDDAVPTWAFRRLPSVNQWLTGTPADLEGYLDLFGDPARLATTVAVVLGDDPAGTVVGDVMLRREDAWAQLDVADDARGAQVELGWVLDPAHEGHGYATEAVRALMAFAFEHLGARRLVATSFLDNTASWRLMERVGMRRETHAVRDSLHRSGSWLDTVGYAVLRDEWSRTHAPGDVATPGPPGLGPDEPLGGQPHADDPVPARRTPSAAPERRRR
ncbi:GNAT family protein [Phycicoccus sp.]|uniref:GNAT family N-acetyltransferase n=1 Tax=Phycicoccus sp. TaxID=1902410 RepID=UPI002C17D2E2|nr:GNAT family protein [Phycicoccus sp.]HMM94994.1 GNAT family protein [Phycicoccus sp.]